MASTIHLHGTPLNEAMTTLMGDLLGTLGIRYFAHVRIQKDGYCSILSSHIDAIKICLQHNALFPPIPKDANKNNFYQMLFLEGSYSPVLHEIQKELNLGHFINLYYSNNNYIDTFCFGTDGNDSGAFNRYLNHLDILGKFKIIFNEKFSAFLRHKIAEKQILPHELCPILPFGTDKNNELTLCETNILSLYAKGETARSIAEKLNRSPRTIETHLENIKSKLNLANRTEIIIHWHDQT